MRHQPDERTQRTLRDFLAFADLGARLVARGRAAFDADEMLRLAAEAILHRIGEAVSRLDSSFTEAHPEVAWRRMKGMRNVIAHDYDLVDHSILWNALESDLPREAAAIARIVSAER